MIHLPKPSQLRLKGTPDEKINYLLNYILTLVPSIERHLSGIKSNDNGRNHTVVKDINAANNKILVIYTDGSEKQIDL